MQQDLQHHEAAAHAAVVAQQGQDVARLPDTIRRAGGSRVCVRGRRVQEVRCAGVVPEPPHLREAPLAGGGGVRVHQPGAAHNPLRRVPLRGGDPVHIQIRSGTVRHPRGSAEEQPRGPVLARVPPAPPRSRRQIHLVTRAADLRYSQ